MVLIGDHGWNLREHGMWCKHSNFETSLHVPLVIKIPQKQQAKQVNKIVEFVDIYPTLIEIFGLPLMDQMRRI